MIKKKNKWKKENNQLSGSPIWLVVPLYYWYYWLGEITLFKLINRLVSTDFRLMKRLASNNHRETSLILTKRLVHTLFQNKQKAGIKVTEKLVSNTSVDWFQTHQDVCFKLIKRLVSNTSRGWCQTHQETGFKHISRLISDSSKDWFQTHNQLVSNTSRE